MLHYDVVQTL